MRKLIVQELVSIDGYFAGPQGEIDWHRPDEEYQEYAKNFLCSIDLLLFGRATYELMASYWPTATGDIADLMNSISKIVVSKTLKKSDWSHTKLLHDHIAEEVVQLKQQRGKDLAILGSADLASTLRRASLIDEYQLTVVPVVLGDGKPLFQDMRDRANMKLIQSKVLRSGCIQLHYQPV